MTRSSTGLLGWLLLSMLLPAFASAQDAPDIRDLRPFLMLVVDTSGSMERRVNCPCLTSGCTECLPDCDLLNTSGVPADKKNRWALTLEALTGSFKDFQCEKLARTAGNGATYDRNYYLPYHQPWDCAYPQSTNDGNTETVCKYTDSGVLSPLQNKDGILDTYESRVRFGLMTFDGVATYSGAPDLVEATKFSRSASDSEAGLWSYAGPKAVHYPGCAFDYMVDSGARHSAANEGALVSLNSCATPPCDAVLLNGQIQDQLLKTRPYGGTPIAASLDDLYFHLNTDLTDSFGSCRNRLGMLITDGYPDADFRDLGCDCTQNASSTSPGYCGASSNNDPSSMKCPYPLPEEAARDLVLGRGADGSQLKQLFVVGLAVDDAVVRDRLNAIALEGGGTPYVNPIDSQTDVAYFADDLPNLVKQVTYIINQSIDPISRTPPVFGQSRSGTRQFQVSSGFELASEAGFPWTGILERRRFECNGTAVNEVALADNDRFHELLDIQATRPKDSPTGRNLYTPRVPFSAGVTVDSALFHSSTPGAPCGTPGNTALGESGECRLLRLSDMTVTELGLASDAAGTALKNATLDWMYAANGSVREGNALADVYHSTPVIVGSPEFDTTDASFNEFRASEVVADRPVMMYVGTNDGILHAFSVETFNGPTTLGSPYTGINYTEGQEVWGFVPALFQNNLPANLITHQFMADGSPVVKDVYFNREHSTAGLQSTPAGTAGEYHTVLVAGLRNGGEGYYALDVTNPAKPEFLWQFTDPDMGDTYGQPAIIQAVYDPAGNTDFRERAVAILPGGKGTKGAGPDCPNGISYTSYLDGSDAFTTFAEIPTATTLKMRHRRDVPCYEKAGRVLYFVDVETGKLIKKITSASGPVLPAPIVSTPVMHNAAVGTLATEGYVTDMEGVIWRIDISSIDPKPTDPRAGWTMRPYHDLFWDDGRIINGVIHGEVSYEKPVLTTDPEGRLVVITGTGDTDDFGKDAAENRVASLTTVIDPSADFAALTPDDYRAAMNWEKRVRADGTGLVPSELVTGGMTLFQGQLMFATFISVSNTDSACDLGKGRLHAVDYHLRDTNDPNGSNPETFPPVDIVGITHPDIAVNVAPVNATDDTMVFGLAITQRPSCAVVDTGILDVWGQSIPVIDQLSDPSIFVVAQVSSGASRNMQHAGSRLGSLEVQIQRIQQLTRLVGWATTTD